MQEFELFSLKSGINNPLKDIYANAHSMGNKLEELEIMVLQEDF